MADNKTPSKLESDGSYAGANPEEEALTPLANLKMLIRVASETEAQPSRRELFKDEFQGEEHSVSNDKFSNGAQSECREYAELQTQW